MVKLFLCVLIVCACGFIGFEVSLYYKRRQSFFSDLLDFLQYAKTQISYFQYKLADIYKGFETKGELGKVLEHKAKLLNGETNETAKKPYMLTNNEWLCIDEFLCSLGKADAYTVCSNIDSMTEKVQGMKAKAQEMCVKRGSTATKLGIAFGLAIAIIIV